MNVTLTTSDQVTIGSSIVTVVGIIWALYERTQAASARREVKHFRHLLLRQEISQQFSGVPDHARILFSHVRKREYGESADAALQLSADLASLNGLQGDLIGDSNKQQLEIVLGAMREINQRIPKDGEEIESDSEKTLMESCNFILLSVYAIERSLRIKAALGGDDDGK